MGTENGSKAEIPIGGHLPPSSMFGDRLLWKKAQKNDIKNITSEMMKSTIPQRKPFSTIIVCSPWYLPSQETSRHHWNITNKVINPPKLANNKSLNMKYTTNPMVSPKLLIDLKIGHGDMSTKW